MIKLHEWITMHELFGFTSRNLGRIPQPTGEVDTMMGTECIIKYIVKTSRPWRRATRINHAINIQKKLKTSQSLCNHESYDIKSRVLVDLGTIATDNHGGLWHGSTNKAKLIAELVAKNSRLWRRSTRINYAINIQKKPKNIKESL